MSINKNYFNILVIWITSNFCFWNIFWNFFFLFGNEEENFLGQPRIYSILAGIILAFIQWLILNRISSISLLCWIIVTLIGMQIGTLSVFPAFALNYAIGSILQTSIYNIPLVLFMSFMTITSTSISIFQAYEIESINNLGWIKSIGWVGFQFLINILSILTVTLISNIFDYSKLNIFFIPCLIFSFQLIVSILNFSLLLFLGKNYNYLNCDISMRD